MKTKILLTKAQEISRRIRDYLSPGCDVIEGAGSIRRCRPMIGDIEIVAIPKLKQASMFDVANLSAGTMLDDLLAQAVAEKKLLPGHANGPKYKSFILNSGTRIQIDIFIVTPPEWGVAFTIRTGSADFSRKLVTQQSEGGYMPGNWYVKDNRLHRDGERVARWIRPKDAPAYQVWEWAGGELVETPSERGLFEAIELNWTPPAER